MESRHEAVIHSLYAASLDAGAWPVALTRVADALGAVDTTLEVHSGPARAPDFFACGNRLPNRGVEAYLSHYAAICPRIPMIESQAVGSVGVDYDFISESGMNHDAFYSEFLAPDDLRYFMSASLAKGPGKRLAFAAVHRSPTQGHATPQDTRRLRALLPHLQQSLDTHLRLRAAAAHEDSLLAAFEHVGDAVVLLDKLGRPVHVSHRASTLFGEEDGLSLAQDGLAIADGAARSQYQRLLASTVAEPAGIAPGGDVAVPRTTERLPYIVRVRRLPPTGAMRNELPAPVAVVMLLISDPSGSTLADTSRIADVFDLTVREAEVVAALAAGDSLREHAHQRGVRISTARFHLYRAMAKMGVRRQSDVIRLVASLG
ncbi:MAG: helix-turn-helix transcriptional regulator [Pseudomonadales bacterium]|nr:helix-turn-helix transcriptional regulator [Pseudomonadales bacterium]